MTIPILRSTEPWSRLVVAVSGSTGLIGSALVRALERTGHEVRPLVRRATRTPLEIAWDPEAGTIDSGRLAGIDAVVNLAGEKIAQRWTDGAKGRIRESRVKSTAVIANAIAALPVKPAVMISGSAVGIYGNRGDESLDDDSALGDDFLASVCKDWEAASTPASDAGIRVVQMRTGVVLARDGGALQQMLMPFRIGIGGKLGSGAQWMSWIGYRDAVAAITFLLTAQTLTGPVNVVAPNPVTNEELTRALARMLHRPALLRLPRAALHLLMGEMADDTLLASQRVHPRRLLAANFSFSESALETALRAELAEAPH